MDYIITSHVIKTVKGLKEPERSAIANAIVAEFVLGENPKSSLTPVQAMLFAMIRDYIRRDSARHFTSFLRVMQFFAGVQSVCSRLPNCSTSAWPLM